MGNEADDEYSEAEAARRRDAVIRAMVNTPPQPRVTRPSRPSKKGKKAGSGRAARKGGAASGK